MSFNRNELDAIEAWAAAAKPLSGIYYRSVEYRFMDPKEVLNGRGAEAYGGRFASVGTRAVFLAESDSAASDEVLARKRRLGGNAQITLDKYPRIVFGVTVTLERVLDLNKRPLPKGLASVRQSCLAPDDLTPSMELGDLLRQRSVQGIVLPQRRRPWKEPDRVPGTLPSVGARDSQCCGTREEDASDCTETQVTETAQRSRGKTSDSCHIRATC